MILRTNIRTVPSDLETPVGIYLKIRDLFPQSALLESSDYHTTQNSTSLIGVEPIGHFCVTNGLIKTKYPNGIEASVDIKPGISVVEQLRSYMESFTVEGPAKELTNGLLGFTAYDAVKYFESVEISQRETKFVSIPDMMYVLYRFIISVNHFKNEMTIIENLPDENSRSGIDDLLSNLRNNCVSQYGFSADGTIESPISDREYKEMVKKGISHARRGDVFQIVLSRRFSRAFTGDEFNVYRALRSVNPSPYLFYFDFGNFKVFGSSPETHLKITGRTAFIDPIAGTFKRTGDDRRDHELATALLADEKENAEHVMLVDLARNDLSRSGGTVSIDFLRQIQFYSHVIHMVSRVKAILPEGSDRYRLFADTFPAGTLSGAPKVRAMQLIDEIEPHSRVTYGGCIGYLGFNGDLNQAITIRSFLSSGGRLYSQAGAGIVARSIPENELQETNNKLGALSRAIVYAEEFGK